MATATIPPIQAAKDTSTPNIVKGRVEIKGTRSGVAGLIVRIYDVAGSAGPPRTQVQRPLGSTITSGGALTNGSTTSNQGAFEIHYDDDILRKERPDGSRPDLMVSVFAPEARTNGNLNNPIFESDIRQSASREECFLIHVDLAELKKRKVLLPPLLAGAVGDPEAAGIAAEIERDRQAKLREQINEVRKKAVVEARKFEDEAEKDLRNRVVQHLTGLTPDMPQWKRFVAPGEDAQKITREHHKEAIGKVINKVAEQGTTTYLVLSAEELAALGSPPNPGKVEQRLRQKNPTPSLLREDPVALACLRRRDENPFDPRPLPAPSPTPTPAATPTTNVDAKVSELVQGISIPEAPAEDGGRPDQTAVEDNVKKLKLSKGPADVPAFYDFHNLQIAFDHVWEDARADGALETAKVMYRSISDAGGDPKLALKASRDPMRALSREVNLVRQAQSRFAAPSMSLPSIAGTADVIYTPPRDGFDGQPDPGPPMSWPGFNNQIDPGGMVSAPLVESYPFTLFADKSVNFGLLVTYSQRWVPGDYQVGRLVSTQTLAPKETISLTLRKVVKTSFNRKQVQSSQKMRKEDADETLREEAEIVGRAQAKSNFALTSQGGYDLGPFGSGSFTTSFGKDKESDSQETKKAFHEAVSKSAQEFRDEIKWEEESGETIETETTEKRELSNPNDELALTYIFYELQRRYLVSERLKGARPVLLVGQHVPRPNEINDDWIRSHDWIIKRFLPDDSFRPAIDYLATQERGDQIVLAELKAHMESLRKNVNDLKQEVLTARSETFVRYAAIEEIARSKADLENREDFFWNFYNNYRQRVETNPESKDALKILDESAREGYERALREERDLRARMDREITALQVATDTYIKAQANYTNQRTQIDRLIQYLRSDILRFMHGIWSYEHPDQRFLRHHTIQAPRLESLQRNYTLEELSEWPIGVVPQPGKKCYRVTFTTQLDDNLDAADKNATLAELADLDQPLGFKGNYIIFPLKKSNALTDFMLTPYLDAELGLRDPDGPGNWTLQEFSDYVQCLRDSLGDRFAEVEAELRRQYQALLADPLRDGEEIIVPTKSLYMQMLVDPGKALEEFKEQHRMWDVEKVKAEVLSAQLDNLRRAKMVLDGHLNDPNVESVKNVYYRGQLPPHDGDE